MEYNETSILTILHYISRRTTKRKLQLPEENASVDIIIIICKDKNRTVVEYALKSVNKHIEI